MTYFDEGIDDNMMAKSMRLNAQLEAVFGKGDQLAAYRKHLNAKLIRAEVDGWPSPEAFSQFNIRKYIKEMTEELP